MIAINSIRSLLFAGLTVPGQCICKSNVAGIKCDSCVARYKRQYICRSFTSVVSYVIQHAYNIIRDHPRWCNNFCRSFNLTEANPAGCQICICNANGTMSDNTSCNEVTGQCACRPNVIGDQCDTCVNNYWNLGSGTSSTDSGCKPCLSGLINNTFMFTDSRTNECLDCHPQCLKCYGTNAFECVSCRNVLRNSTCVATCGVLEYADVNSICQPCNAQCSVGCSGT